MNIYQRCLYLRKLLQIFRASFRHSAGGLRQVMSIPERRLISCGRTGGGRRAAYRLFRSAAESFPVPSWSTSFRMPCTLAFILKTCRDRDDCRLWNALSSFDCGVDDAGERDGPRPASISAKLIFGCVWVVVEVLSLEE